jgi:serine phosphatase RsbU (regulator of sigma subunit)/putative methionine-R-sulfoxide reductase with GAF domain
VNSKRERWLIVYSIGVGVPGFVWLAVASQTPTVPLWHVLIICALALLIDSVGFREPPADPHTLTGIIVLSVALAMQPGMAAVIAGIVGCVIGIALPFFDHRPLNLYTLLIRPFARAGVRVVAVLLGVAVAQAVGGWVGIALQIVLYPALIMFNRAARMWLHDGMPAVRQWWRGNTISMLFVEIIPLPLALLGSAIYTAPELGIGYFVLFGVALFAASVVLSQVGISLRHQQTSTNELAILNATSRAIIRSELDVDALCELIYREAGNVLDTSSFHLGIFAPNSDRYTLKVRVQDRQRLDPLTVDVPSGDGIIGWMRQTGRSLLIADFKKEMDTLPARPRYQSANPPNSGIYVPLISGNQVIGSISVQSHETNAFTADDLRRLSQIADQAAVAISKARTFNEARQRAAQLQAIQDVSAHLSVMLEPDELLPEVMRLIREHLGYHPVHCITVNEQGILQYRATTADVDAAAFMEHLLDDDKTGIIAEVARTGQPVLVNDVHNDPRYVEDDPHTRSELAVPMRFADRLVGILDVQSSDVWRFDETDVFVMQTLADQVALALERAKAFSAQREEAWRLNVLLQAAAELNRTGAIGDLLNTAVRLPLRLLDCRRCCYLSWDKQRQRFIAAAAAGLSPLEEDDLIGQAFPATLFDIHSQQASGVQLLQLDVANMPGLQPFGSERVLILVARGRSTVPGILLADYDLSERVFGERERRLFTGLAGQIGSALENALLEQEADNAARLEEELRLARDIQTSLLPAAAPHVPGWEVMCHWRAARVIGGDFYDYWPLTGANGEHLFGFVIADVSDKGMAAALFMALSRSLVRAAALDGSDPAAALTRANRWITRDSESGMFVTLFYGILDLDSGVLRYCCAGHNPPLVRSHDGSTRELATPGIALGVIEEASLHSASTIIAPGDTLVCYTDGVTESFDEHDELYGVPRLIDVIQRTQHEPAATVVRAIADDIAAFSDGRIFDDVTMLVIRRTAEQQRIALRNS